MLEGMVLKRSLGYYCEDPILCMALPGWDILRISEFLSGRESWGYSFYKIVYEYGAWRIYIDNTYQGGSTQPLYAKCIQVGLESLYYGNSCRVVYSSGLQVNEDGVWKGWSGNLSSIYQSPEYHFSWVTPLYNSNDWNDY